MKQSMRIADSVYGVKNSIAYGVLKNDDGKVWAIEAFNIYARRHVCINLYEAIEWNGKETIQAVISLLIAKV